MKKILSFFAAMLVAVAVNAETVPVAAGSNALRDAVASASAGDVLELGNGTFAENGDFSINKDLTIKAAENANPVIANVYYLKVDGGAQVTFQGLEFDGSGASDHCVRSHNNSTGEEIVTFDNCEFHNYPSFVIYAQRANRKWGDLIVKNCYFYDNKRSSIYVGYESGTDMACQSVKIENSTFVNTTTPSGTEDRAVVSINNAGAETNDIKVEVDHCTFYNFVKQSTSNTYTFLDVRKSTDVAISNCIFAQPAADMSGATYVYGGSIDNCLTFNGSHRSSSIVHFGVTGDPLFVNAAEGNLTLGEGSPALNAGTDGSNLGDPRWWPAAEEEEAELLTLYLKLSADWAGWPARYAIYTWKEGVGDLWAPMTLVEGEEDIYTASIPADNDKLIFVRLNGETTGYNWDEKWSKTVDLDMPEEGNDFFTVTTGGTESECNGTWSKYGEVIPEVKFYIAGSMTNWNNAMIAVYEDSYTFENLADGNYQLKVVTPENVWLGYSALTAEHKAAELYPSQDDNVCFSLAQAGDVTITYIKDEVYKVEGSFVPAPVKIVGMNGWDGETDAIPFIVADDHLTASTTIYLDSFYCEFKMIVGDAWLGKVNEDGLYGLNRNWTWVDGLTYDGGNIKLVLDDEDVVPGDYIFTWDYAAGKLTVTFPEKEEDPAKFYITGAGDVLGNWNPAAIKSTADTYTLNLEAGSYKLKITVDGTWETGKGIEQLTERAAGLQDINGNIGFVLAEAGEVNVTYTGEIFKLEGAFVETPIVKTFFKTGGTWDNDDESSAAWNTEDETLTVNIAMSKDDIWQGQVFYQGPAAQLDKLYDVSMKLVSNKAVNVNIKYSENAPMFEEVISLEADEEYILNKLDLVGQPGSGILHFDVRNAEAGTVVTVSEISIIEKTPQYRLQNGYYLVGVVNGVSKWTVDALTDADLFVWNTKDGDNDEFKIYTTLKAGDKIKGVYVYHDEITSWYPSGDNNDFEISEDLGEVTVFLRPNGDKEGAEGWHYGCLYIYVPEPVVYCDYPSGHFNNANFGDPNGRILLTIERVEGTNIKITVKHNTEAGNPQTGFNRIWVNATNATNNNAAVGEVGDADVEGSISVVVTFAELQDSYTFNNIHWSYNAMGAGEWAIDGLTVAADELCVPEDPGTGTAISNTTVADKAVKVIENGQLYIILNGVRYNAQGQME